MLKQHQVACKTFLDGRTGKFRKADLAKVLYPLTNPRSLARSIELAGAAMTQWAKSGKIVKCGHIHWIASEPANRTLAGGRQVREAIDPIDLTLKTKCPEKWVSVDLETGEIWRGTPRGWKRATEREIGELAQLIKPNSTKPIEE